MRRADALTVLAERFLARVPEADESLNSADRFVITVHASAEALPEHAALDPEDSPQFEDGSVAAPETVRRLGCDFRGDGFEVRATSERFQRIYADAARQRRACLTYEVQEVRAGYPARPPPRRGAAALAAFIETGLRRYVAPSRAG